MYGVFDLLFMKTLIISAKCLYLKIVQILGMVFNLKNVNVAFIEDYRGVENELLHIASINKYN